MDQTNGYEFERILGEAAEGLIGYLAGSERVFFLKTGQGGDICGYENKYLQLAHAMRQRFGCSVFVSTTVRDDRAAFDRDMQTVADVFGGASYEMDYLGVSKGGLIGCWYGIDEPNVRRIVTVNAPLMLNFHNRTLPVVKRCPRERLTMVYGSRDPSCPYLPFLQPHAQTRVIAGADHHLRGGSVTLAELAVELFSE
jgi:hypothetical protein